MAIKILRRVIPAVLVATATTLLGSSTIARAPEACAEPQTWDIENYDECMATILGKYQAGKITFQQYHEYAKTCCEANGGVWNEGQKDCAAPPGQPQGSRQLPGNIAIPPDIATAPGATRVPPRPIPLPPDIANAPPVTAAP